MRELFDSHSSRNARDQLDIDRFLKAQSIIARVLGDKPSKEDAASAFFDLSSSSGIGPGHVPCAVFCDWQLRRLLARGMNWRQIVRVVRQCIQEIQQEQADDPGTIDMVARSQHRQAESQARRLKAADVAHRSMLAQTRREVADMDTQRERQRREEMLQELNRDGWKYHRKRESAFNQVHADSMSLSKTALLRRYNQTR